MIYLSRVCFTYFKFLVNKYFKQVNQSSNLSLSHATHIAIKYYLIVLKVYNNLHGHSYRLVASCMLSVLMSVLVIIKWIDTNLRSFFTNVYFIQTYHHSVIRSALLCHNLKCKLFLSSVMSYF